MIHNNNTNNNYDWYTTTIYLWYQPKYSRWNINNCGAGTLGQEKRYMHINVHTLTHIYIWGGMRENIYIYIRWFITNLQETPWVDAKRNKVLLVSSAVRPCWCGRNIVCTYMYMYLISNTKARYMDVIYRHTFKSYTKNKN